MTKTDAKRISSHIKRMSPVERQAALQTILSEWPSNWLQEASHYAISIVKLRESQENTPIKEEEAGSKEDYRLDFFSTKVLK